MDTISDGVTGGHHMNPHITHWPTQLPAWLQPQNFEYAFSVEPIDKSNIHAVREFQDELFPLVYDNNYYHALASGTTYFGIALVLHRQSIDGSDIHLPNETDMSANMRQSSTVKVSVSHVFLDDGTPSHASAPPPAPTVTSDTSEEPSSENVASQADTPPQTLTFPLVVGVFTYRAKPASTSWQHAYSLGYLACLSPWRSLSRAVVDELSQHTIPTRAPAQERLLSPRAKLPSRALSSTFPTAYVCTVGVWERLRGLGVANLVLAAGLAAMYVRHAPWQVYLHVLAGNTAAIGLYEKFGFTAESLIPHFYFFKGQWHDAYNMVYKYKE